MRRSRKIYKRPARMWDKARIERDKKLRKDYGLTREHEIWKAETVLRKYRRLARELVALKDKEKERALIAKLVKIGILEKGASLDDVLGLSVEDVLERRLQTVVFRKNLANTPKHARQLIAHGHVIVDGKVSPFPGRMINKEEEHLIEVTVGEEPSTKLAVEKKEIEVVEESAETGE